MSELPERIGDSEAEEPPETGPDTEAPDTCKDNEAIPVSVSPVSWRDGQKWPPDFRSSLGFESVFPDSGSDGEIPPPPGLPPQLARIAIANDLSAACLRPDDEEEEDES